MSSNGGDENGKYLTFIELVNGPQFQSRPTRLALHERVHHRFSVLRHLTLSVASVFKASQGEALNLARNTFCARFPEDFLKGADELLRANKTKLGLHTFFEFFPRTHKSWVDQYECVVSQPNQRFQSLRETQKYVCSKLSLGGDVLRRNWAVRHNQCLIE